MRDTYENLLSYAEHEGIIVEEFDFDSNKIKGLYSDGVIGIKKDITTCEKRCTIVEELGHYFTSVGDIIDQTNINNRKQERKARKWGYCKLVHIEGLVEACKQGCRNSHEIAEYLEVTEEFLQDALHYFKSKYGAYYTVGQYTIYFNDFGYYVDMK